MTQLQITVIETQIEVFREEMILHIYENKIIDNNIVAIANEIVKGEISKENMYEFKTYLNDLSNNVTNNPKSIADEIRQIFQYVKNATNYKITNLIFPNIDGEFSIDHTIYSYMLM